MYTQNGKAKAQNNITKAAKINTVFKPCMNKVASLLIGRKQGGLAARSGTEFT